jgi:hypothetical protein
MLEIELWKGVRAAKGSLLVFHNFFKVCTAAQDFIGFANATL